MVLDMKSSFSVSSRRIWDFPYSSCQAPAKFRMLGRQRMFACCPVLRPGLFPIHNCEYNTNHFTDVKTVCMTGGVIDALVMLHIMDERGILGRPEDYAYLLQECGKMRALRLGKQVHTLIIASELETTPVVGNALVDVYCRCGSVVDARSLFDRIVKRDTLTWSKMLAGYTINGSPENALKLYGQMEAEGVKPDEMTFFTILKACAKIGNVDNGYHVHRQIQTSGVNINLFLRSSLVDMYAKCGSIVLARQAFDSSPVQDVILCNAMLAGYVQHKCFEEVLDLFLLMIREDLKPDRCTLPSVLKACIGRQCLESGRTAHAYSIMTGLECDLFVGSTLVDMYAKCGSIMDARKVFDRMPIRSEVSWNVMIGGYAQPGHAEESLKLFWEMGNGGRAKPSMLTYVAVLKACGVLGELDKGKEIHARLTRSGISANMILENMLVDVYGKCGSMTDARQTFDDMPKRDTVTWNVLIGGYAQNGPGEEAFKLYMQMEGEGAVPDTVSFLGVLKACASLGALQQGKQVHAGIMESACDSDIFLACSLVDVYAKCGSIIDARSIFDKLKKPNEVAWNSLIAGYVQNEQLDEAFKLVQKMDTKPGPLTLLSILKACSDLEILEQGKFAHYLTISCALELDFYIANTIVDMYAKCGDAQAAQFMFDSLPEPNLVSWNALIGAYAQQEDILIVFDLLVKLEGENMAPNEVTFLNVMGVFSRSACLKHCTTIHFHIVQSGYDHDLFVANSLIDVYFKCNRLQDAHHVFKAMPKKDIVTWNAMIGGYCSVGLSEEALRVFRQMESQDVQPDEVTFLSILKASASIGSLEHGRNVHKWLQRSGLELNTFLGTALIDMYSKCGSFKDAHEVFESVPRGGVVAWNAMITGYVLHGNADDAFKLFLTMKEKGVEPDRVTFANILKACGSLGALEQGKQIHSHIQKHGSKLDTFLANSLIDMYGKCASMERAKQIFDEMEEHDRVAWNAMIYGYAQNGHVVETLKLFDEMQADQELDHIVFVSVLSACNHGGLLAEGWHFFASLKYHDIMPTHEHYACMIDMLGRAGCLQAAMELMERIPSQPNVAVWMSLLGTCRINYEHEFAKLAAKSLIELEPHNPSAYVLLSNIHAEFGA